ncbi:MAG TPA: HAD hydrolase-like protein [Dehalococcoidia bacterium]|nr:HAD hydrolase-like protein [Dehalococcoidia bacterium]
MRYPVIFFDLDGTLTDPTEGITKSVQYALAKFGIATDLDQLRSFIGPPLHHSFMAEYGFDEPTSRRAVEAYREYFGDRGIFQNRMFEGIPELLQGLRRAGGALCVVTSKPTVYSEQIVRHFGLDAFFDAVIGPGLDLSNAEKATLVRRAMDRYAGHAPAGFVMVGDREHDIIGACANAIDSVGVTYGAGSRQELTAASATHIVDTLADLEALLRG